MGLSGTQMTMTFVVISLILVFVALAVIPGTVDAVSGTFNLVGQETKDAGKNFSSTYPGDDGSTPGDGEGDEDGDDGGATVEAEYTPPDPQTFDGCQVNCG